MNHYTQLLRYIKTLSDQDDFINTITQGDISEMDLDKGNIFPMLHVDINDATFTNGNTVQFNIEIACVDIRDNNKTTNTDKYYLQDNKMDNLNETMSVLNRLWIKLLHDIEEENIHIEESASLQQVENYGKNMLDGWLMSFVIDLPNTDISLC